MKFDQQQHRPQAPVLIEPDSETDMDEPPRKRSRNSEKSGPLDSSKIMCLLDALRVLRSSSDDLPHTTPANFLSKPVLTKQDVPRVSKEKKTLRRSSQASSCEEASTRVSPQFRPTLGLISQEVRALRPLPAPRSIPGCLPPGRPLMAPPRLPRLSLGENIKRKRMQSS